MALNTEVGGSNSNSYGSIDEFITYINKYSRLGRDLPDTADTDLLEQLLIVANEAIDQLKYVNWPTNDSQALEFPRNGLIDKKFLPIANNVIPTMIKEAQFEMALYMYQNDMSSNYRDEYDSVQQTSISGNISFTYDRESANKIIPESVKRKLLEVGNAWISESGVNGVIAR